MRRGNIYLVVFVVALAMGVAILGEACGDDTDTDTALLLARTCVAEIGLHERATVQECELMWQVNQRRAKRQNRTISHQTRLFNSFWEMKSQRKRRPYIVNLDGPGKPLEWPSNMRWQRYQSKWLAYRRAAVAFVRNPEETDYLCPRAIDYGAPNEIPKMKNMVRIHCLGGNTRQWYWAKRSK